MRKLIALLILATIVIGAAGLAAPTERASAQELDLNCSQTIVPDGTPGAKGEITCTLTVSDLPDPLEDFTLTLVASYVDVDGSTDPSPGDQLQCITVLQNGQVVADFCRPGVPEPPAIPTPPPSP